MIVVKICGITSGGDAKAAVAAGAQSLGFNFYEKSARRIGEQDAGKIRGQLAGAIQAVGVFVNAKTKDILATARAVRLDAVQLHGDESAETVSEIAATLPVIKAFRVGADFPMETFEDYSDADAFLLDAARAGQYGGTGQTGDWAVARRAAAAHRIILAGGLKIENVAAAIRLVRPYGVDVASGVEAKPGKKDHKRMIEFIQEVRRAEKELGGKVGDATQL